MVEDKTVEALQEEIEFQEDKIIQLKSSVKKLREELETQRKFYEKTIQELKNSNRSGSYKISNSVAWGYEPYYQAVNYAVPEPQVQAEPIVAPTFDEALDMPDPTFTITNIDTHTGVVTLGTTDVQQPLTTADRIARIEDLLMTGIINDAGARDLIDGLVTRNLHTGEIIQP